MANRIATVLAAAIMMLGCSTSEPDSRRRGADFVHDRQIPAPTTGTLSTLRDAMFPQTPDAEFTAMARADRAIFAEVIAALWSGVTAENYPGLYQDSRDLGFEIKHLVVAGVELWLLREDAAHRRGGGSYLFRTSPLAADSILLEAPHVYFDIGTGAIAVAAFLADAEGRQHALYGNTSHRYQGHDGTAASNNPADPAHNKAHPLHLATVAVTEMSNVTVVQLHGFAASAAIPSSYAAIISAGIAAGSTASSTNVARAMMAVLDGTAARFPEESNEMGATTNVQGQHARSIGLAFVSIELSAVVRAKLAASPTAAAQLSAAILAATAN